MFNIYNRLIINNDVLLKLFEKFLFGMRINRVGDDVVGLVIFEKMRG